MIKSLKHVIATSTLCLLVLASGIAQAEDDPKIYWGNLVSNRIQRANLDGTEVETIILGTESPSGIAIDLTAGKLYFADPYFNGENEPAWIQRADLDGNNREFLVTGGLVDPSGVALDLVAGKIYWGDHGTDKIQRSNLDGSDVEDFLTVGANVRGIVIDQTAGKIYWADRPLGDGEIHRANLDGSEIEDLIAIQASILGLAVDPLGGKIYWADGAYDRVQRANLDGSDIETLVTDQDIAWGVAVDSLAGKLYWTAAEEDKIRRANLDGTDIEELVTVAPGGFPAYIALGIEPAAPPADDVPATGIRGLLVLVVLFLATTSWVIRKL